ncbi:MAG TPA: hypothetical protein VL992_03270, partial [Tepidisphaeraceae bacterium]|nr:hypothetical protein [Tepidisphaeraceae bacterium]
TGAKNMGDPNLWILNRSSVNVELKFAEPVQRREIRTYGGNVPSRAATENLQRRSLAFRDPHSLRRQSNPFDRQRRHLRQQVFRPHSGLLSAGEISIQTFNGSVLYLPNANQLARGSELSAFTQNAGEPVGAPRDNRLSNHHSHNRKEY